MASNPPLNLPAGQRVKAGRKEPDQRRPSARDRGYDTKWDKARRTFLLSHPHCVMCMRMGQRVEATIVDHAVPHRLGAARTPQEMAAARKLFWDKTNWQPLCVTHHSSAKQREEKGGGVRGNEIDGRPTDPSHPWNRRP